MPELKPERIPGPQSNLRDQLTDRKAWTDGVITPLIFLTANGIWGLRPAAVAAAGWGIGVALYRLIRRQKVSYAFGGLIGLGIALLIALRTGRASTYFLPNVVFGTIYGIVGLISVLLGRPASAAVARLVEQKPTEWYRQRRVKNAHMLVTAVWSLFFLARSAIRYFLISTDSEAGLALTTVVLGLPATALLVVGSWAFLKKQSASVPPPQTLTPEG